MLAWQGGLQKSLSRRRPEKKKNKQKSLKEMPGTRAFRMKCCQESFNAYKMTISIIPGWILVKCKICGIVERAFYLVSEAFSKY